MTAYAAAALGPTPNGVGNVIMSLVFTQAHRLDSLVGRTAVESADLSLVGVLLI